MYKRQEDILDEISPIEDYSGTMSLTLSETRFEDVQYTIDECKDKDSTTPRHCT